SSTSSHRYSASSSSSSPRYSASSSGGSSGSLSDVPGVPRSFAACVALRESTNLRDPAANGNAYGIIPASGHNVNGTSLSNQKQPSPQPHKQYGSQPWAPNGC